MDTTTFPGSAKRDELMPALSTLRTKVGMVSKEAQNPHFKSSYASLPHILSEVDKHAPDLGLLVTQPLTAEHITAGDKVQIIHRQQTRIEHVPSGQFMVSEIMLDPATITNPQKVGSALTYARRYTICSLLALIIDDEDDDGNAASGKVAPAVDAASALKNW